MDEIYAGQNLHDRGHDDVELLLGLLVAVLLFQQRPRLRCGEVLLEEDVRLSLVLFKQAALHVLEHHQLLQVAKALCEDIDQTLVRVSGLLLVYLLKAVQIADVFDGPDVVRFPLFRAERVRLPDQHLNDLYLMRFLQFRLLLAQT